MLKVSGEQAHSIVSDHGSPVYVYSTAELSKQAKTIAELSAPFGFLASYAMKANPHPHILSTVKDAGMGIDASSSYEVLKALDAGFDPALITLTSQQLPDNLSDIISAGVEFNACSLHQLRVYCQLYPGTTVGVRINPGMGSGTYSRVTTGGVGASFGIWHEYIDQVLEIANNSGVSITRLHTHIGSGADTEKWLSVVSKNLELVNELPDVSKLNVGGGFKYDRMNPEKSADIVAILKAASSEIKAYAEKTGRKLHLEIEPGTWVVAGSGSLLCSVIDVKDTGKDGHTFAVVNTGMNDIIRPAMYGAQHPITVYSEKDPLMLLVAGHNCESSDMFTIAEGDPETLAPRLLPEPVIGDIIEIGGVGAYCAGGFRPIGYNSFPSAPEIFID